MIKIKFLLIIILLLSTTVFTQNLWQSEVSLNFTVQSNTKVSSFVDENGIHIVYSRNGGIRYALVNSQGGVIKYNKVIEAEGSGTDYANVVADGNNVYAIYYKNNDIKVAKSTNLGNSWNTTFSYYDLINTGCNKIVAYKDDYDIRITWSEKRVGSSYIYDVHYIKFTTAPSPAWSEYRRVSENEYDGGDNPDLAFNSAKVEVNYTSFSQPKNRERLSNNNWNNSEDIPYQGFPLTNQIMGIKPMIVNNTLNTIYTDQWNGWDESGIYLGHSYRNINGTTWNQNQTILVTDMLDITTPYPHVTNNTANGKIHIIYWDKNLSYFAHRYITGTTVSSVVAQIDIDVVSNNLNSNSNDLYLVYSDNPDTPGNIKFRHYDDAPLAPQNLDYSVSQYNHPLLEWDESPEPDISTYYIYKKYTQEQGFIYFGSTGNNYFEDETETFPAKGGLGQTHNVWYYVKAIDIGSNVSDASNTLTVNVAGAQIEKRGRENNITSLPETFELNQNYPNPFNPTTQIVYSLAQDAYVTVKVYDLLGNEILSLVNSAQTAGKQELKFNGENLSSGVYIYRIVASKNGSVLFTNAKQMILMK